MDYLKEVLDRVDSVNAYFPSFPGSPRNRHTIREFLEEHLNSTEFRTVFPVHPSSASAGAATPAAGMQTAPRQSCLVIRFLRKEPKAHKKYDDILTVTSSNSNKYTLRYTDKDSKTNWCCKDISKEDVNKHISISLRLVLEDSDPYDSVQVVSPIFPTVLFDISNLDSQNRKLIYEAVEFSMSHWATV